MEAQLFCAIAYEVLKSLNNLNPHFRKQIFYRSPNPIHRKDNLFVVPLCSFPKHCKIWIKKLKIFWSTPMELIA